MKRNDASVRSIALGAFGIALLAGGAANAQATGETLFKQRCMMCHTHAPTGRNGVGPGLYGLSGKPAASAPGFAYSSALKASKLVWTSQNLDQFLAAPNKVVPGTRMVVSVPNPKDRKDIVAYLVAKK